MSVVRFPQSVPSPGVGRLLGEIESTVRRVADEVDLSTLDIVGALEWAKLNVFYGADDE